MAPERLRGEDADERSDIFSAGTVLYEMATGTAAFPQRNIAALVDAIQHEEPVAPTTVNPHLPVPLERIILKAIHKDRLMRHGSASELAASLDRLSGRAAPRRRVPLTTRRSGWRPVARGGTAPVAGGVYAKTL
jgi:serine/threonine protein kinase